MRSIYSIIILFLMIQNFSIKAQPGCPNIYAGSDTSLDCTTSCVDLTSTFLATGATTTYAVSSVPYAPPYPYSSGNPILVNTDDIWSGIITLPFSFCFFGTSYNQIVVGSNGCISFGPANSGAYCAWSYTASCPDANIISGSTGPYVLGPYHDIDPGVGGDIYEAVLGSYPCRTFVVNYNLVPMFSCNSLIATQQIVLYESTNVIEVYIQNKPVCSTWNGGVATIGIQDAAGTTGFTPPGRNTGVWTASNEAWRFTPNGTPNFTVSWWQGSTQIGSTATVNVCPADTTVYTAQIIYDLCTGSQLTLTDDVTVYSSNSIGLNLTQTNPTICGGDSSTITASTPNPLATFLWNTGATDSIITVSPATTTTYTVTATAPGCTTQASITVTVVSNPVVSVSGMSVCNGQPATLTASGATTYAWSNGGSTASIIVTPSSTTTYTVTGTTSACTDTASYIVTVNPQPSVTISSTDAGCSGNVGTASAIVTGGSGSYTYLWNSTPPQSTQTATGLSGGTYIVTVTDNNGGCTDTEDVIINQSSAVVTTMSHNDVLCHGICTGTATVTVTTGTPPYTYYWSDGQITPTASGLCAGIYSVTVTDNSGCVSISNTTVLEPAQALQSWIFTTNVSCFNQPTGAVNLAVSGGVGWPNYTYYWNPGGSTQQDLSNVMAGTYYVTITDANGCTLVDTAVITQPATPVSVIVTSQNLVCHDVCEGLAVAVGSGGTPGLGGYTYNWDTLNCVNDSLIDVCAGTFYVTVTDGAGCTVVGGAIVDQPPEPAPLLLTAIDVLCYGDTTGMVELNYADILPTNSYQWSTGDTTQDIEWLPAGWYQVTVTTIDSCIRVANITVNQPADPLSSSFNITDVQCYNDSNGVIDLTVNGGTSGYTYYWSPQIGGINPTTEDLTDLFLGTDSMTYYVTITDANGCITYDSATIHQPQAVLNAVITGGNINCYGDETGWASINPAGGTQPWTYLWSDSTLTDSLYDIPAGLYSVTVTDAHGCDTVYSIILTEPSAIDITLVPINDNCPNDDCDGSIQSAVLGGTPSYNGYTYVWSTVPPQTTANAVLLCADTYGVTVTDSLGCSTEEMATITTSWQVNADAIAYPTSGYFILPVNFTFTGSGANSYLWDFGDGTPPSTDQDPFHEFAAAGTYTVTLIAFSDTPYYCQDTFFLTIEVLTPSSLIVPNVFTPNGDGVNDEFYFDYEAIAEFRCAVYNRWGKLIYEWDDISHGWDGKTENGKQLSDEVYFYILSAKGYDDIEYEMHGTVTLLR